MLRRAQYADMSRCGALFIYSILLLLATLSQRAWAVTGIVPFYEISANPSNALKSRFTTLGTSISCYDDFTFELLACPYSYQLVGVDALTDPLIQNQLSFFPPFTELQQFGGHEHDQNTHPFYWLMPPATSPITAIGGEYQYQSPTTVSGNTFFSTAKLTFSAPEVAGTIWERIDIGTPPGWYCIWPCYTTTDSLFHSTYFVGYQGFDQLNPTPRGPTNYVVIRNPDTAHPDTNATWGDAYTIKQLEIIANIYQRLTGDQLSINDMSLPYGGVFDIGAITPGSVHTWQPPHKGHRVGFAFDVNTQDGAGQPVACKKGYLKLAVEEFDRLIGIDPATVPSQIYCESHGRIHINAIDESLVGLAAQ